MNNVLNPAGKSTALRLADIPEPRIVALVQATRGGSKLFQSFVDDHDDIIMVPGYPLMYLNHHWDLWLRERGPALNWAILIDLVCEKHASIIDSRNVPGLSGLDRLGDSGREHIELSETAFRRVIGELVDGAPLTRRNLMLAVHFAYAICKGWDLKARSVLFFHAHHMNYLVPVMEDFPETRVIVMVRLPVAGLASTARSFDIVDPEKLNETDAIVWANHVFWRANQLEFDTLHRLGEYCEYGDAACVRLETLHENTEGLMRQVAAWMGLPFRPSMLQSSFDGKIWWGDVTNKTPVSGPDPNAMSDKWTAQLSPKDQFVIEGIALDFYRAYGFPVDRYRTDSWFMRAVLQLLVMLPMRREWQQLRFYFSPRTHARMIRAAIAEANGITLRKDYTWNGTYLFKWTYDDLRLWEPRLQDFILGRFGKALAETSLPPISAVRRGVFVCWQYLRLWAAALSYPRYIFLRVGLQRRRLQRRLNGKEFLPIALALSHKPTDKTRAAL